MKIVRILVVLCAVAALAVAFAPRTQAGNGSANSGDVAFMSYSPGGGLSDSGIVFTSTVTCNITCLDGSTDSQDVEDAQGCVDACNEFCHTTTCRLL